MPTKKKLTEGPRKGAHLMDQFGLGVNTKEFESMLQGNYDDDDDDVTDADIHAELAALDGEVSPPKVTRQKGLVTLSDINKMAAESMQDITSDDDMSENEDPDLLRELDELMDERPAPVSASNSTRQLPVSKPAAHHQPPSSSPDDVTILKERLAMYSSALSNTDEPNKKRRLTRGITALENLIKDAKAGRTIAEDSIPPPVSVRRKEPSSVKMEDQPIPVEIQPPLPDRSNAPRPLHEESPIRSAAPIPPPRNAVSRSPVLPPVGAAPVLPSLPPKPSYNAVRSPVKPPPLPSPMPKTHISQPPPQQPKVIKVDQMKHPVQESSEANSPHNMLCERRDQYKFAAVTAKKSGDIDTATKYAMVAKQFENVIKALQENKPIDLSKMPPPPPGYRVSKQFQTLSNNNVSSLSGHVNQGGSVKEVPSPSTSDEIPNLSPSALKKLYKIPDAASSVEGALQQRMNKYKSVEDEAKKGGNGGKGRRMGRIVKEYENAIKMYKAGKTVNFDELPTPPGFPPIPMNNSKPASSSTSGSSIASSDTKPAPMKPPPAQPPMRKQQPAPQQDISDQEIRKRAFAQRSVSTRQEQQITFLKERMAEYRQAAIQARKNQNMELAKAYLRQVKGFEPMIDAAEGGLPVDLSKVPPPLITDEDREDKFMLVNPEDCTLSGDREEVFKKLKESLVSQIQMCSTNNKHFTKLGDVLSASRFQTLEQNCIKDLDSLKNALHHGDPVPRFHYETTTFSMVKCNTDLGDNDFELTVVRGINYNPPSSYSSKDLDTYVKFEFPFPTDDPQVHTIETVKSTDSPEYNESARLQINRKARAMLRIFEKKSLKFEVYYRRGFLKSDKVLGTVTIKLQCLENKCTVHDSYDLMDGRKSLGGKLEVKLRLRDPIKNKQVEEMKEKLLIIDQFIRKKTDQNTSANATTNVTQKKGTVSMEVLKFEKQQLDKQISHLRDNLNQSQLQALTNKSKLLQEKLSREQEHLKTGGRAYWKAYIAHIEKDMKSYAAEAQVLAKRGDIQKAHIMMTKKKLVEKEIAAIQSRIPDI